MTDEDPKSVDCDISPADDAGEVEAPISVSNEETTMADASWIDDLREVLADADSCDLSMVRKVAGGRVFPPSLRLAAWRACLNLSAKPSGMRHWDGIFDLPCQSEIGQAAAELSDGDVTRRSDIESIATAYCKLNAARFERDSYVPLLRTICRAVGDEWRHRDALYDLFEAIMSLVAKNDDESSDLFRLFLQYHDPELSQFLDSHKLSPNRYLHHWLASLLSDSANPDVVVAIWDIIFQCHDPYHILFMVLVLLINAKDDVIGASFTDAANLVKIIGRVPSALDVSIQYNRR